MNPQPRILALFGTRSLYGAERANMDALRALKDQGAEVTLLVREDPWPELDRLRTLLTNLGLPFENCPYPDYPRDVRWWPSILRKSPAAYVRANRTLIRLCQERRITHIHSYNPWFTAIFSPALGRLRLPLVYRCGDAPSLHNMIHRHFWTIVKRHANRFVADSYYIRDLIEATHVPSDRIEVLYAPPPQRPPPLNRFRIEDHAPRSDGRNFVFVGRVTEQKGIGLALEAFQIVLSEAPDSRLFIAGSVEDSYGKQLLASAQRELFGKIFYLGEVDDVPGLLGSMDVHLAPSLRPEAYGLVVVEAKQAGIPSVILQGGGMSELVLDGVDGSHVTEKTPAAFARALLPYCRDIRMCEQQGRAALASLHRFQFDQFPSRWLQIYRQAAI